MATLDRIERVCAAGGDPLAVRLRIVEELRRLVRFDAYVFVLTDPETAVGSAPLADVPAGLLPELPMLIRLKYLSVNRWTGIDHRRVAFLRGSPVDGWSQLLRRHGVGDVASLVFRDRFGWWGFLDLWRSQLFEPADARALAGVIEPVTAALRRSVAGTFRAGSPRPPRPGPVVLVLSRDLVVVAQTAETEDYLRTLVPPDGGRDAVPAGAYNVAAQLLAVEGGAGVGPPRARVHLADGLWLTLRAAALGDDIAVSIEESSSNERVDLFVRCFGLSGRERELLELLVQGQDTRYIAGAMYLSDHTVQDHLKSIFAKTGTRHRKALVSLALGT